MLGQMTWMTRWTPRGAVSTPLTDTQARVWSGVVLVYLALAYYLINYTIPGHFSAEVDVYVVRPLIWCGLGILSFLLWRRVERPLADKRFFFLALLASAFSVSTLICAGLLFGFGHSPYSRDALHMAENLWYITAFIAALEMSRAYLMAVWGKVNPIVAFMLVALIYAAVWQAPGQFENIAVGDEASMQTFGRTFMPAIAESVMATFLVAVGGPLPAIIYHLSMEGFRWLSPILPTLGWTMAAFIGTLTPAVALLIVRDAYLSEEEAEDEGADAPEEATTTKSRVGVSPFLLLAGAVIVAAIWLNTGMFGVTPYLVSGPSMRPGLAPGDIIFSENVDPADIEVGDVIRYQGSQGDIIHRVIQIDEAPDGLWFTTKGDNNSVEDPLVPQGRVKGKVVFDVPYAGWVPIKLRELVQ